MEKTRKSFLPYLISFITAILLMSGVFAVEASAATGTCGDYEYYYNEAGSGNATITAYNGTDTEVVVPSELDGHKVTSIGKAFKGNLSIVSVTLPDTVESIVQSAFMDCSALKSINIPDEVTAIEYETFQGCSSLESITLPDSVTSIGDNAFYYCIGLKSAALSENLTSIGQDAFYSCCSLEEITIPKGVTTISYYAFGSCENLKSLTISDGVAVIKIGAFVGCNSLTSITLPDSVTTIEEDAFSNCGLTSIYIPEKVTVIEGRAFDCPDLSEYNVASSNANYCSKDGVLFDKAMETLVACPANINAEAYTIPDTVTSIAKGAFTKSRLKSIIIPDSVTSIGNNAFNNSSLTSVKIPDGVTSIEPSTFLFCVKLTSVTIPVSVTSIGENAFLYCAKLKNVYYSGSSSDWAGIEINESGNDYLTGAEIHYNSNGPFPFKPTNVKATPDDGSVTLTWNVVEGAAKYKVMYRLNGTDEWTEKETTETSYTVTGLTNDNEYNFVVFAGNDSAWSEYADEDIINAIPKVIFEYTVTDGKAEITKYIGTDTEVYILPTLGGYPVTSIGDYAFEGCNSLKSVTIPDSITSIGDYAFYDCYRLESVTIGNSVTSIGECAFGECGSLLGVTIPDSVTSIGNSAFYGCNSLESVTIPDNVTSIGYGAFSSCNSLTSINVSSSNKNYSCIDGVLFDKNKKTLLAYPAGKEEKIYTIPDSVTSIGEYAFSGCTGLTSITIPDSVTSIGNGAFGACAKLTSITIPDNVTSIGYSTFNNCQALTSITIPNGVTSIGDSAFSVCVSLESVTIPDSVTSIGYGAFSGCTSLTSITIPDSVTSIGVDAFAGTAYYNDSTNWDNGVLYIGRCLIDSDYKLTSAVIKEGTALIANNAFYNSSFTSLTIPDSVKNIGNYAFYGCSNLKDVYYSGSQSDWAKIEIGESGNDCLLNAAIHYGKEDVTVPASPVVKAAANDKQVTLTWNAVEGAAKYKVQYRLNGTTEWAEKETTETSYDVTGLTNGKKYDFVVLAGNEAGWSEWTEENIINATPVAPELKSPEFTLTPKYSAVQLDWKAVSGAIGYRIYSYGGGYYWEQGTTKETTFTVSNLVNGVEYGFIVQAYNSDSATELKADNVKTAVPMLPVPDFTITAGSGCARIDWKPVEGAVGYNIYSYDSGYYWYQGSTTETTHLATGLWNDVEYFFLVQAYDANGSVSNAYWYMAKPVTPKALTAPEFTVTPGSGLVKLDWKAVEGATGYRIYSYDSGYFWEQGTTKDLTYTVNGLWNGTTYAFLVQAYNDLSSSDVYWFMAKEATPKALDAPEFYVWSGDGYVSISWYPVSGASYYRIYSYDSGYFWEQGTTTDLSFTVNNLWNGTEYAFLVQAVSDTSQSDVYWFMAKAVTPQAS